MKSNNSIPNFGGPDSQTVESKTVKGDLFTTKTMPHIIQRDRNENVEKYESILDISGQIEEETESNGSMYNPFKNTGYRHSKTSEDL